MLVAAAALVLTAGSAWAGRDTFALGDGHSGSYVAPAGISRVNACTALSSVASAGAQSLAVASSDGFTSGDLLLLLETTASLSPTSGSQSAVDVGGLGVGRWELARVATVSAGALGLSSPLLRTFPATHTQVVLVPEYTSVTVGAGRTLAALSWNGTCGGVLAFLATGEVLLDGTLSAAGAGFRGGATVMMGGNVNGCTGLDDPVAAGKGEGLASGLFGPAYSGYGNLANGGGGGNCFNAGGGGGSGVGLGGNGGRTEQDGTRDVGGRGGAPIVGAALDRLLFGGGGGGGHANSGGGGTGGAGGGALFIRAASLLGAGQLLADGAPGGFATQDAAGGGGGAGTLHVRIAGSATCGAATANGGNGGNVTNVVAGESHGPGGGGSGGRSFFQVANNAGCPSSVLSGIAGVQDNSSPFGPSHGGGPLTSNTAQAVGLVETLPGGFPALTPPVLVSPGEAESTGPRPTFSGSAHPNAEIELVLDGIALPFVTAASDGSFSLPASVDLAPGEHSVIASALQQSVWSPPSSPRSFKVVPVPEERCDSECLERRLLSVGCNCGQGGDPSVLGLALLLAHVSRRRALSRCQNGSGVIGS
ncbi:MAG: adventurous gliding motility protein AgmC [Myxococcaceae bacterium]